MLAFIITENFNNCNNHIDYIAIVKDKGEMGV